MNTLYSNNILSIDGKDVGQLMAVTESGQVQNATASRPQTKSQFRPLVGRDLGDAVKIDLPVYLSTSPSDHYLNPALMDHIKASLA